MSHLIALILLSGTVYRITRFLVRDELIAGTRDRFVHWLQGEVPGRFREKALTLVVCPFCMSIYVSMFACLYWFLLVADWPGWAFPLWWLTAASVALMMWRFIEPADD